MAEDLWRIRRRNQLTIEQLARLADVHPSLIKAYELGQRPIPPEDLAKLAHALQVEPWQIKELSDPPPRGPSRFSPSLRYGMDSSPGPSRYGRESRGPYNNDRSSLYDRDSRPRYENNYRGRRYENSRGGYRPSRERPYDARARRPRSKKRRGRRQQPAGPARPTQIEHLKTLMIKLNLTGEDLLRLAGKPLSMLNRKEAARLLGQCQAMLAERRPPRPKGKRQRPYLPESVDEHELVYLTQIQLSKRNMYLTLFNGDKIEGKLLGFSPYALTLTKPDGQEITVQKLAIAYYQVEPAAPEQQTEEPEAEVVAA